MIVELLNNEVVNIYSAEPTNRNVNYTYVNAPYVPIVLNENQIRIGLKYENEVVTDVVQDLTNEQILSNSLQKESDLYYKRMQDGKNMYAEISAEFRLAKLSGLITEEQHGAIEDTLIPVRNEVLAGQWISALQKLEAIGVVIGSELYDRLHNQISNYISNNY